MFVEKDSYICVAGIWQRHFLDSIFLSNQTHQIPKVSLFCFWLFTFSVRTSQQLPCLSAATESCWIGDFKSADSANIRENENVEFWKVEVCKSFRNDPLKLLVKVSKVTLTAGLLKEPQATMECKKGRKSTWPGFVWERVIELSFMVA